MVAAGGVIGTEAENGSRSLASSEVDDVAGIDDELLGGGDVGSSKMGRRASSSTASEVSSMD